MPLNYRSIIINSTRKGNKKAKKGEIGWSTITDSHSIDREHIFLFHFQGLETRAAGGAGIMASSALQPE